MLHWHRRRALTGLAEVNNLIGNRVKKPRLEGRSYVVPDHILVGARDANSLEASLDSQQMVSPAVSENRLTRIRLLARRRLRTR